jgi:hypothetical protein
MAPGGARAGERRLRGGRARLRRRGILPHRASTSARCTTPRRSPCTNSRPCPRGR